MSLIKSRYGKGHVRVMRIERDTKRHVVRELTVEALMEGDFSAAFTSADNSKCVSTDTVKNVVNVVARENLALDTELFCKAVADKMFATYPQVDRMTVTAHETKWTRMTFDGQEHEHSFILDSNGKPFVEIVADRKGAKLRSGIDGFTFMKTTQSGWDKYAKDPYTTIPETRDRMCATSIAMSWNWTKAPADYTAANAKIMDTMLKVFATTYSESVQDSLYRMAQAALAAVPEISDVSMAAPNKHYLLINLTPFGLDNDNRVFLPTDEPHGQIECTVGRG